MLDIIAIRDKRKKVKTDVKVVRVTQSDIEDAIDNCLESGIWKIEWEIKYGRIINQYEEWAVWSSDFNIVSRSNKVFLVSKRLITKWIDNMEYDIKFNKKVKKCDISFLKLCKLALDKLENHPDKDELLALIDESEDIVSPGL